MSMVSMEEQFKRENRKKIESKFTSCRVFAQAKFIENPANEFQITRYLKHHASLPEASSSGNWSMDKVFDSLIGSEQLSYEQYSLLEQLIEEFGGEDHAIAKRMTDYKDYFSGFTAANKLLEKYIPVAIDILENSTGDIVRFWMRFTRKASAGLLQVRRNREYLSILSLELNQIAELSIDYLEQLWRALYGDHKFPHFLPPLPLVFDTALLAGKMEIKLKSPCLKCSEELHDPHITYCCGSYFCKACIESENELCPQGCKTPSFELFSSEDLTITLKATQIHCSYQTGGCEWIGTLCDLNEHWKVCTYCPLSLPHDDLKKAQCSYQKDGCNWVGSWEGKGDHEKQCQKRPFVCKYCNEYESIFEDVEENHFPVCKCYPSFCPNKCTEETFQRQQLDHHINNECPLQTVTCTFQCVGCDDELTRERLQDHMSENVSNHLALFAAQWHRSQVEQSELKQEVGDLIQKIEELKLQIKTLTEKYRSQEDKHTSDSQGDDTSGTLSLNTTRATDRLLSDSDLVDIKCYLISLNKNDIYNLGLVLGLTQPKVMGMEDSARFLDKVLCAWLHREDNVEKKGMPSWRTLMTALNHPLLKQTGIAKDIKVKEIELKG